MEQLQNQRSAFLLLADGTVFEGKAFGESGEAVGEVVFSTGMTGYQEALTDPSYYGQILTQTFPLIGNYGVNSFDDEADKSALRGYIVREWCESPSNFRCEGTIDAYLKRQGVVGLYDIDTRALTRRLREAGVMNGLIAMGKPPVDAAQKEALLAKIKASTVKNPIPEVTVKAPQSFKSAAGTYKTALLDYGYKRSLRDCLLERGCDVTVLPAGTTAAELAAGHYDGLLLSGGPGDPMENPELISNLREILSLQLPVLGVGLGHQLTALALGAKTAKMKHGHRGANQPVTDLATGHTFATVQNHGYEVLSETLPAGGKLRYQNVNDKGCEGIVYENGRILTVQFYPADTGSEGSTNCPYDQFVERMTEEKGVR